MSCSRNKATSEAHVRAVDRVPPGIAAREPPLNVVEVGPAARGYPLISHHASTSPWKPRIFALHDGSSRILSEA